MYIYIYDVYKMVITGHNMYTPRTQHTHAMYFFFDFVLLISIKKNGKKIHTCTTCFAVHALHFMVFHGVMCFTVFHSKMSFTVFQGVMRFRMQCVSGCNVFHSDAQCNVFHGAMRFRVQCASQCCTVPCVSQCDVLHSVSGYNVFHGAMCFRV